MEADFWHAKWEKNEIGFHLGEANPALVKHVGKLGLAKGARVFVPLCGKTLDIGWLLGEGFRVAGAELSELAVQQLFGDLGIGPSVTEAGPLKCYSATGIDIFVGDIFDLDAETLGPVDATYDRAALVALPPEMRDRYTAHVRDITHDSPQLLLTFAYDQTVTHGPPFSVTDEEVMRHYDGHYSIERLSKRDIPGGIRGLTPVSESVWLLLADSE